MKSDLLVVGLGYVGLPLVVEAVRSGLRVQGLDVSAKVVEALNSGVSHVDDLSDDDIQEVVGLGFRATTSPEAVRECAAVVICVPTPLSREGGPDLSAVVGACEAIAPHLESGTLVVLESTTYPGTTEEVVQPILEQGSGLTAGRDFHLAFSPERIDPGNKVWGLRNTPKIVGGLTPECTSAAAQMYGKVVDQVVLARGIREAEAAKLLENTYRHVNIALVNEMVKFFHELGVDFWDVIKLAESKPFGFQAFRPGPGVGGHCIPIDPNYLSHRVRSELGYSFRFVELAQEINATMPVYVARRVQDLLNQQQKALSGSRVLLLGVTYKADIADTRESPATSIASELMRLGADVRFHDPHVPTWTVEGRTVTKDDIEDGVPRADVCVLLQAHSSYDPDDLAERARTLLDTRGVTTAGTAEQL